MQYIKKMVGCPKDGMLNRAFGTTSFISIIVLFFTFWCSIKRLLPFFVLITYGHGALNNQLLYVTDVREL